MKSLKNSKDATPAPGSAYTRRLWHAAVTDAKAFWTDHKVATTLVGGFVGFLASAVFKGLDGRLQVFQALIVSVLSALGGVLVTFVLSIAKAPKLLDDERIAEIKKRDDEHNETREKFAAEVSDLRSQIQNLMPPKRTSAEEQKHREARAALANLGPNAGAALRHLERQETLVFSDGPLITPVPDGMSLSDLRNQLNLCVSKSLVKVKQGEQRGGGAYPVNDVCYMIAPGMKTVLLELLYPSE